MSTSKKQPPSKTAASKKAVAKKATAAKKTSAAAPKAKRFTEYEERERGHRYAKVIARAWADEKFRKRLMDEPAAVLGEFDIAVPKDHTVKVVSEAPATKGRREIVFVLPAKPRGWIELESRSLTASPKDDWLDGGEAQLAKAKPRPKPKPTPFPCAKCWNGCC
ncbi:nitrile hydratase subunit alpha [Rhizobacter sp. AJA081-3]|uniref:nitrile hydratase subunit alpha n=1 Tax=Rhizobacter sp. AJA081-3 TaxID=2753607 RepID=UPI001ADF2BB3|nr:nitrile hydratase subunit alpha [Rhizobacter sp. AJA081-3]QTN25677.1 nitrile hydratase subunit alpha [Rhizobacter sp. AJA081-3]